MEILDEQRTEKECLESRRHNHYRKKYIHQLHTQTRTYTRHARKLN